MRQAHAARNAGRERWWASEARDFSTLHVILGISHFLWQSCQFSQKMEPSDFRLPAFLQTQA